MPLWENAITYLKGIKVQITCIPHHFLYSISRIYCTNDESFFLTKSIYFHCYLFFYQNMLHPKFAQNMWIGARAHVLCLNRLIYIPLGLIHLIKFDDI